MGERFEIARADGIDGEGNIFTEEVLRAAAERSPLLRYDERTKTLYAKGMPLLAAMQMAAHDVSSPSKEDLEIEEAVIEEIRQRRGWGRDKYKKTMEREDLGTLQWAQHALEESLDHSVYLKKFMREHRRRLERYKGLLEKAADMILYYDAEYTNDDELPSIVPEIRAAIQEINEELNGVSSI